MPARNTGLPTRFVLERKLGRPIRLGFQALHHCDHPACCQEKHLYEGTQRDNVKDTWERNPKLIGRRKYGPPLLSDQQLKVFRTFWK
jgi:hypothetical protein